MFTSIYCLELLLKVGLYGAKNHFRSSSYVIFDCFIVVISLIDVCLEVILINGDNDLLLNSLLMTFLRGSRIIRLFKLAKYWRFF